MPSILCCILAAALSTVLPAQSTMPAMEHMEHKPKTPSTTLTIHAGATNAVLTPADLAAMPQRTLVVHNGHSNVDETYTGPSLTDILAKYGYTLDNGGAKKIYHSYVRAEGTDHYYVLYSASELEDKIHTGDSIIALTVDGKPLAEDGKFKLVVAGEKRPARWVTNLNSLTIVTVE